MRGKWVAAGFLAVAALAYALPARAGDTVRLGGVQEVPAQQLVDNGQGADTVPVWYRGYGFGGYRGFGWGGYRGFGWGGYRGFGYGLGYRGFGYGLGYRGLGYGLGYRRFGYGLGYRGFGYGGYGLGGYGLGGYGLGGYGLGGFGYPGIGLGYWGCSGTVGSTLPLGMSAPATIEMAPLASEVIEEAPVAPVPGGATVVPGEETYPYDGGPSVPVPQPQVVPEQAKQPATPAPAPARERAISLPKPAKKRSYPAYGEQQKKAPAKGTLLTRDL